MQLTDKNLREIKTAVNRGFGLKVSRPNRTKNQTVTVYKTYVLRPAEMQIKGPLQVVQVKSRSPRTNYVSARNLKPGNKLSPGSNENYRINRMLMRVKT